MISVKKLWRDQQGSIDQLVVFLIILLPMLFVAFISIPVFVYVMRLNNLTVVANHTLKEAEAVGYVSPTIIALTNQRLAEIGLGEISVSSKSYPSYEGSTTSKVLRDSPDPTVKLVIKYPANNITQFLLLLGKSGGTSKVEGYMVKTLKGRSEAYE